MPANTSRNTILRQWELLKLLPSRGPGKTATQLAEALAEAGYKVSKRQVERDLGELLEAFEYALNCNNAGVPYGWHWVPGASVDLPGLSLAEALSLNVIEGTLKPLLPKSVLESLAPRFKQAQARLDMLQPTNRTARWVRKVRTVTPTLPLLPPKVDPAALTELQEALLADEQVRVRYRSAGERNPRELMLHPLALVQRGPVTYLVATAFSYQDIRLYAAHRFTKAERTGDPVQRPPGFDIDRYLASGALQFGSGGLIQLEMEVSAGLAGILAETPLAADQKITETEAPASAGAEGDVADGHIRLSATLPDSQQLRQWLLGQGTAVKVLGPGALRDDLRATLQAAVAQYATP